MSMEETHPCDTNSLLKTYSTRYYLGVQLYILNLQVGYLSFRFVWKSWYLVQELVVFQYPDVWYQVFDLNIVFEPHHEHILNLKDSRVPPVKMPLSTFFLYTRSIAWAIFHNVLAYSADNLFDSYLKCILTWSVSHMMASMAWVYSKWLTVLQ